MSISLKELKKNRLTPAEKWLLERIDSAEPEIQPSGVVRWYNKDEDEELLFIQDFEKGYLWVSYQHIWKVLYNEFGFNDNEIQELIKNVMYDYTNNGELTPNFKFFGL